MSDDRPTNIGPFTDAHLKAITEQRCLAQYCKIGDALGAMEYLADECLGLRKKLEIHAASAVADKLWGRVSND